MISSPYATLDELFRSSRPSNSSWLPLIIEYGLDQLPMPGEGATLDRWRALAVVAQFDLSLAKLYEGHTDALAIFEEIGQDSSLIPYGTLCVWAAEAPSGRAHIKLGENGDLLLSGSKHWCSGALTADYALLTAWDADGTGPHLVSLDLHQPGIGVDCSKWKAVGMAKSMSVNVSFKSVNCERVGQVGEYLNRPGFWHGGAGIAACWYGGTVGIASALRQSLSAAGADKSGYGSAALGKIELALKETASILKQSAQWIDDYPLADASHAALLSRLSAEKCAKLVMDEAGRAVGAGPFCLDEKFAQAIADLTVFIRQSHYERDFAALGERVLSKVTSSWTL